MNVILKGSSPSRTFSHRLPYPSHAAIGSCPLMSPIFQNLYTPNFQASEFITTLCTSKHFESSSNVRVATFRPFASAPFLKLISSKAHYNYRNCFTSVKICKVRYGNVLKRPRLKQTENYLKKIIIDFCEC